VNKKKIINDPLYGFITISSELIFDVIETPEFQRLRRINQMGLADFVYPGALHTRFHHALGAMHLMSRTLDNLRDKNHEISNQEYESALLAILLHDVGHGPFSHSLEEIIMPGISHEKLSLAIMRTINSRFNNRLSMAIEMFTGYYYRPFFHQLITSQLDVDRLDYLNRDSFFTGVSEGTIGAERIIKLFDLVEDEIVVEEKGIYSVENFLNARRLMYWQVYLHKTGLAADKMLVKIMRRARDLMHNSGQHMIKEVRLSRYFAQLDENFDSERFENNLTSFCELDDHDVWSAIKEWRSAEDPVLAHLCTSFINRKLFKIVLSSKEIAERKTIIDNLRKSTNLSDNDLGYFYDEGEISNSAYIRTGQKIKMLRKSGEVIDIEDATDLPNINAMSRVVSKNYFCWANKLEL
jgi:HD superfamily phosphohydrolase